MKYVMRFSCLVALMTLMVIAASAQKVSLKNNLLYDLTTTPNLGAELMTGDHNSLQLFYGLNTWSLGTNKRLKHWSLMPEWRHWRKETFRGLFYGIHGFVAEYNIAGIGPFHYTKNNHLEGTVYGAGLTLGHAWRLAPRWNLEAALGVGYAYTSYDRYENRRCGECLGHEHRNYVGPTKLALNMAWLIGPLPKEEEPQQPVIVVPPPTVDEPYVPQFRLSFIQPKAQRKVRHLNGRAYLDFRVNKTDIDPTYRRNTSELDTVLKTINVVRQDPNTTIDHISIHGYASPEGSYQNNTRLAEGRAQAFKDYLRSLIHLDDSAFSVQSTPEDWRGLQALLPGHSELSARDAILQAVQAVVGSAADTVSSAAWDGKALDRLDQQLRRQYPQDYRIILQDIYPALRHSDYEVTYTIRSFSVTQARQIYRTHPDQLGLNELYLMAQELTPGTPEYEQLFLTAVRLYPDDPVAALNAAVVCLQCVVATLSPQQGVTDKANLRLATDYLMKAGQTPEALNARAVVAALDGQKQQAMDLFRQAANADARHNQDELQKMP